jgi:hypothetical protein
MFQQQLGAMNLHYSQVLRAVGAYAERANLTELRIMETADSLILQGLVMAGANAGERATYQLTREDLQDLHYDGFAQRGKKM